jgi:deoxyribose-phosphate aldolase
MTQAKYAETKIAIQNGASGVAIPVNMDLLANGIKEEAKLDLANAAVPAEGTGSLVIALVELGDIPEERAFDALAIAESAGADEIRLSWILSGRPADREFIARFIRRSGLPVSVVGGMSRESLAEVAASGACGIGAGFEW